MSEFEPCESCKTAKQIEWCPECVDRYFDQKDVKTIKLTRIKSDDPRFQKLGPCQLCGDYKKPCYCFLEKENVELRKFKNDIIRLCSLKEPDFKIYELVLNLVEKEITEMSENLQKNKIP